MLWSCKRRVSAAGVGMVVVVLAAAAVCGCGASTPGSAAKGVVNVAYAGSLVNLMEHKLGPAFQHTTGYPYQGEGAGSTALTNQIKGKLIHPDVFISASSSAIIALEGKANGNLSAWYASFASTELVIGYNPKSQFASGFRSAASAQTSWYHVLETPGMRLGRTDPALDPKGVNTLFVLQLAELYYQQPGLSQRILGPANNNSQIFPEQDLVARMGSGQLDAGFFYLNEVKDSGLPYITLPAQINLGDPTLASYYAQARYTSASGRVQQGAPVLYDVTILTNARNEAGAEAFVRYVLGSSGQDLLSADGIRPIKPTFAGDATMIPASLRQYAS